MRSTQLRYLILIAEGVLTTLVENFASQLNIDRAFAAQPAQSRGAVDSEKLQSLCRRWPIFKSVAAAELGPHLKWPVMLG